MQGLCHQLLPCPAFSEDKNGLVASGKNLPFLFQGHDGIAAADDAFEGIQAARLFTDLLLEIVALFFKIMNRVQKFLHPFRADAGGNAFDDNAVKFPLVIQQRVPERNPLRVGGGQAGTERRLPCADSGHDALFGGKEKVGNMFAPDIRRQIKHAQKRLVAIEERTRCRHNGNSCVQKLKNIGVRAFGKRLQSG